METNTTTTPPKHSHLTLMSAADGGFVVFESSPSGYVSAVVLFGGSLGECLEYMAKAFTPAGVIDAKTLVGMVAAPRLSEADKELLRNMPPGGVTYIPDPISDLEEVLDDLRLRAVMCGVQVVHKAEDNRRVVAWFGDIQEVFYKNLPSLWPDRPIDMDARSFFGNDALSDAAKWLREEGAKK